MAIVKEDGTGLSTANVYADVVDLDAYAALRNEDLSLYDTAAKEGALFIAANDWMDGKHEYLGEPLNATQGLKAPTSIVTIPNKDLVMVNAYTAILQLKNLLFPIMTPSANGIIKKEKSKLDVLEKETEYFEGATALSNTLIADNALAPYVESVGSSGNMGKVGC